MSLRDHVPLLAVLAMSLLGAVVMALMYR